MDQAKKHFAIEPEGSDLTVDDLLFGPGVTSIEVVCWDCGHSVMMKPDQVPDQITGHEFEKRAVCRCGTGWPQVVKHPRKKPTSM